MNTFKLIILVFVHLAKSLWSLPRTIPKAARQRQYRKIRESREVERLDRIRDPEKYRGK